MNVCPLMDADDSNSDLDVVNDVVVVVVVVVGMDLLVHDIHKMNYWLSYQLLYFFLIQFLLHSPKVWFKPG